MLHFTLTLFFCLAKELIISPKHYDVSNQRDATNFSFINLSNSAQRVSGDKFAHPHELFLTVYTAFGTMHCNDTL